jgi:novobiocin biosynthesis protein NovU/D-mycarose 3-C-methyltransferase
MYKPHTICRACGNKVLVPVFSLGVQPLANDFCKPGQERQGYAPLQVMFCEQCRLAQLSVVVKPEVLYKNYAYVTSDSETMRKHFAALAADLTAEQPAGSVVEIGSNNGALLKYLAENGFANVIGIEPAENLAQEANKAGILTIKDFLNQESAHQAKTACGKVDFILARHCFCHADKWFEIVEALEVLAGRDTLIAIEVPYLPDQIANVSFDQCYHEHLSYLSLSAMAALLEDSDLAMHKVVKYPIHGGCVLVMLRRKDNGQHPDRSVSEFLCQENITADTWREFAAEAHAQIHKLRLLVKSLRDAGKTVCGYGASAKSTVWLNACGFTNKDIAFITDTTVGKQHCVSPGTDIPVTDPGALMRELPDYCILWAWNFAQEILAKELLYRQQGGKFIIPVPTIKIV